MVLKGDWRSVMAEDCRKREGEGRRERREKKKVVVREKGGYGLGFLILDLRTTSTHSTPLRTHRSHGRVCVHLAFNVMHGPHALRVYGCCCWCSIAQGFEYTSLKGGLLRGGVALCLASFKSG